MLGAVIALAVPLGRLEVHRLRRRPPTGVAHQHRSLSHPLSLPLLSSRRKHSSHHCPARDRVSPLTEWFEIVVALRWALWILGEERRVATTVWNGLANRCSADCSDACARPTNLMITRAFEGQEQAVCA